MGPCAWCTFCEETCFTLCGESRGGVSSPSLTTQSRGDPPPWLQQGLLQQQDARVALGFRRENQDYDFVAMQRLMCSQTIIRTKWQETVNVSITNKCAKLWGKCHPGAAPSFQRSRKCGLKMCPWASLTSFDSLTCIRHQLLHLHYSWISLLTSSPFWEKSFMCL